jgi:transcriptional regulator with XRE-family HTH domain
MVKVGKRLKMIRKRLGLTQKEFASRIPGKIDYTYVGKIERGHQYPSLKLLERIARTFGVDLGYFFEDSSLTRRKGGKMIKFDEGMRSKQEIIGDLRETPPVGREQTFRLCLLELVADFRDLGKERKDEVEALARELLKVKSDIEEIRQKLGLG